MLNSTQSLINILDMITRGSIDYVKQQIENGIDALMIFGIDRYYQRKL